MSKQTKTLTSINVKAAFIRIYSRHPRTRHINRNSVPEYFKSDFIDQTRRAELCGIPRTQNKTEIKKANISNKLLEDFLSRFLPLWLNIDRHVYNTIRYRLRLSVLWHITALITSSLDRNYQTNVWKQNVIDSFILPASLNNIICLACLCLQVTLGQEKSGVGRASLTRYWTGQDTVNVLANGQNF